MPNKPGPGSAPTQQIAQFRSDGITGVNGLRIPFFTDAFSRNFGFPNVLPVNMISEETPLREERPYAAYVGLREVHYSRPALVSYKQYGTLGCRGVFQAPPVYGGGLFVVYGTTAYNVTTGATCGTIPGSGLVRWACSAQQMVMVANGGLYLYDGTNFNLVNQPNLPTLVDCSFLSGRFVYVAANSNKWWYSEINDAANVTGLDFASAESTPFPIVGCDYLADNVVFFGAEAVEMWSATSDATAPFAPNIGRGFQRGCVAIGTIQFADNALIWVGDDKTVYRVGSSPVRISNNTIEDKISQCANPAAMTAITGIFEGHEMYVLNIPGVGSYCYDFSRIGTQAQAYGDSYQRGEWQEWDSYGQATFRGQVSFNLGDVCYVGDNTTGDLWTMQIGAFSDAGGPFTRKLAAFIKIETGTPRNDALVLHGVVGQGLGANGAPTVEIRWSDDQGRTFTPWRPATMGKQGAYYNRMAWPRCGVMRAPGRLIEVRCSDQVDVVFSHIELNPLRVGD